ncbi:MAG: alkene reductase [Vicinamibacterales bacterium]
MLFDTFSLGPLTLRNRIVMAPMTRNRAPGNVANDLMATYYAQRASIGLIVTEGTSPSPNGLGYARIPGLFTAEHVEGWRKVTDAVHAQGGHIVVQFMHTGRASHTDNLPPGARVVSSVETPLTAPIFTDTNGQQAASRPHALSTSEIAETVAEFATAARLAREAGFDGVEIHGANGYLVEQFLNANVNTRTDEYGGSIDNRNRFALDVAAAMADAIGPERVGIRLSPYGAFNDTGAFAEVDEQYLALVQKLSALGLLYIHIVDHSALGAPKPPDELQRQLRAAFKGVYIASGGFDRERAESTLAAGRADSIAFGRPALANPDLPTRLARNLPLNAPDFSTFYTPGEKGYIDYPEAADAAIDAPVAGSAVA